MKKQRAVNRKLNGHILKNFCAAPLAPVSTANRSRSVKREVEFSHVQSIFAWMRQSIVTGQQGLLEI